VLSARPASNIPGGHRNSNNTRPVWPTRATPAVPSEPTSRC
jgi:hypothetical protein